MAIEFCSTRAAQTGVPASTAIAAGLAPDGGLYLPSRWPQPAQSPIIDPQALADVGANVLQEFFERDALASELPAICAEALNFSAPVLTLGAAPAFVLELFAGPTAAFKDFGARFLSGCLQRIRRSAPRPMTILVATSGDTGGAVAAAFHGRVWARVVILYPRGQVSSRQERQLTCWGGNVAALRVRGSFDDCQRMVKEAFNDAQLRREHDLSSANSINIGRLLPQIVYYAASSLEISRRMREPVSYIVPSGNLGNATAAIAARLMGFPIGRIVLAHNANVTVPDYLRGGDWRPRPSVATLASAMDVGNPSNMERLQRLFPWAQLRDEVSAQSIDDAAIRARIREDFERFGRIWCPHSATAAEVYARLSDAERARPWVIVATAHPAKFESIVEPLIGRQVEVPSSLRALFQRSTHFTEVEPCVSALRDELRAMAA